MMKLKKYLDRKKSGIEITMLFILTNLVYVFMLTVTIPNTMAYAGGMKLLDMMPMGYDYDYIMTLFQALGKKGRAVYLYRQLPVDMIYPLLFAVTYFLLFAYLLNKLNKLWSPLRYICFLPVIAGAADYLENTGIITLLKSYPDIAPEDIGWISIFSLVKSSTTTVFFVVLFVMVIMFLYKMFKGYLPRSDKEV